MSSVRFLNSSDQSQFEILFNVMRQLGIIKRINVPDCICETIGEYATGKFVQCANSSCSNDISVMAGDTDFNQSNNLLYKKCSYSNKYYCLRCMDQAKRCDNDCQSEECMALKFIPNMEKCSECEAVKFNCNCYSLSCSKEKLFFCQNHKCDYKCCAACGVDLKICFSCSLNSCKTDDEISYCVNCRKDRHPNSEYCICTNCYVDAIIECDKCDVKCDLFFKSNPTLESPITIMEKCSVIGCSVYICLNCDENDRNGSQIVCHKEDCSQHEIINYEYYCNQHISNAKLKCEEDYW